MNADLKDFINARADELCKRLDVGDVGESRKHAVMMAFYDVAIKTFAAASNLVVPTPAPALEETAK
jgi:hypothetical protein